MDDARPRPRVMVLLADLHAGSSVAIMPDNFETTEGQYIQPNPVQRWLGECWKLAWAWAYEQIGDDPWVLTVNGDATEGVHHGTKQVISPDPSDHRHAAELLLIPHAERAQNVFIVKGTESHTGNSELQLAATLGATPDPDTGRAAWDRLDLTIAGCRCIIRHHIGTSMRAYLEASQLGIHLNNERLEAARNREPMPTVLACAHRHRYGEYHDESGLCIVTPPWQMLTRYGHKVVPSARTRPGLVVLDWRNRDDGEPPEVKAMVYRAPQAKGVTL